MFDDDEQPVVAAGVAARKHDAPIPDGEHRVTLGRADIDAERMPGPDALNEVVAVGPDERIRRFERGRRRRGWRDGER